VCNSHSVSTEVIDFHTSQNCIELSILPRFTYHILHIFIRKIWDVPLGLYCWPWGCEKQRADWMCNYFSSNPTYMTVVAQSCRPTDRQRWPSNIVLCATCIVWKSLQVIICDVYDVRVTGMNWWLMPLRASVLLWLSCHLLPVCSLTYHHASKCHLLTSHMTVCLLSHVQSCVLHSYPYCSSGGSHGECQVILLDFWCLYNCHIFLAYFRLAHSPTGFWKPFVGYQSRIFYRHDWHLVSLSQSIDC